MQRYAAVAGLRPRVILPVPVLTPGLSGLWVGLVTPVPRHRAAAGRSRCVHEVVCRRARHRGLRPRPAGGLIGFDRAVRAGPGQVRDADVATAWAAASYPARRPTRCPTTPTGPAAPCTSTTATRRRRDAGAACGRSSRASAARHGWYSLPLAGGCAAGSTGSRWRGPAPRPPRPAPARRRRRPGLLARRGARAGPAAAAARGDAAARAWPGWSSPSSRADGARCSAAAGHLRPARAAGARLLAVDLALPRHRLRLHGDQHRPRGRGRRPSTYALTLWPTSIPLRHSVPSRRPSPRSSRCSTSRGCARSSPTSNAQAAAPDLWDDQERAQQVTSRLSHLQGELDRVESLRRRLDDLAVLFELAEDEGDADHARPRRETELPSIAQGDRRARGPHPAVGRVRPARGARHHPGRGRWRRRRRLRRDADADVPALGGAARLPDRGLRHLLRRGGRHQVGDVRGQGALRATARCRSSRAPTGWCASRRSTTRAGGRRRSPASRCCRSSSRPTTSRSPTTSIRVDVYRSSGPGRPGRQHDRLRGAHHPPADRHRRRPARTSARSCRTVPRRWRSCRPSCSSAAGRRSRREMDALKGDSGRLVGQPDAVLRPAPVPDGQGPADRARDRQHRPRCSTARSTTSSRPASAGAGRVAMRGRLAPHAPRVTARTR